jgi:hypothetical protein
MGALYSGRCFASGSDAALAYWSGVGPVISSGSPPSVSTVEQVDGSLILVTRQGGAVLSSSMVPAVDFVACDPSDSVKDGMALGWLVAGVWAAAWAIKQLRSALAVR